MTRDEKLTIAFFTDSYKPGINGVVTAIDQYAKRLRLLGHRVCIFGPRNAKFQGERDFFGVRSFSLPLAPDFRVGWPLSFKVIKRIPDLQIDIVHNHSPGPMGILGLTYAKAKKIPLVQTYHAMLSDYARLYVPKVLLGGQQFVDWWQHFIYNHSDYITAPTPYIATYLKQIGIKKAAAVIPAGLDIDEYVTDDPSLIERFTIPADRPIVATLSRMAKEKNIDFLIEVFIYLKKVRPNALLLIIGGGPYQKVLEREARELGVDQDVIFTGMVNRAEIFALLHRADVFAYACQNDTQGLVVMEAMAAGKPMVLVEERVFEPFVEQGENGYLLPCDHLLFSMRINEILSDETKKTEMGVRSRQLAENYSIDKQTTQLLKLYATLIASAN